MSSIGNCAALFKFVRADEFLLALTEGNFLYKLFPTLVNLVSFLLEINLHVFPKNQKGEREREK